MALQVKQTLKLTQQLIMTPQLQQAIKLLQLNRLELLDAIQEEMEINPVLEEASPDADEADLPVGEALKADKAEDEAAQEETAEVRIEEKTRENDIDWEAYFSEYNSPYTGAAPTEREEREAVPFENVVSTQPDLIDHLKWQLMLTELDEDDKRIGATIIGNINRDGLLEVGVDEIARQAEVEPEQVEAVLEIVQGFDPTGVAARDLRECLLLQAAGNGWQDTLAWRIIDGGLDILANRNYKALAKKFGGDMDQVAEAVGMISSLDPKPGRAYSTETPQYISPDIYVIKVGDDYNIVLNEDGLPKLKINPLYRQALSNPGSIPQEAREFIQEKMRSAVWLIRSIHQRQRTIYRVTESIVKRQREFLERGIAYLKPMVLKDVAEDVEMHESTISRVTTNKYVHTPQGVYELKFFFNSAIQRFHGEALASESVKERIRQIVAAEDPAKPLSDDAIKKILEAENINIARRTVAKYREVMGILPSSKRKRPLLAGKRGAQR